MDHVIDNILNDPKLTKAVLLQLMGMLTATDDSQIDKINQLNQVSIKVLRRMLQVN